MRHATMRRRKIIEIENPSPQRTEYTLSTITVVVDGVGGHIPELSSWQASCMKLPNGYTGNFSPTRVSLNAHNFSEVSNPFAQGTGSVSLQSSR